MRGMPASSRLRPLLALLLAAAIWLPLLHVYFARPRPERTAQLFARHTALWIDPALRAHELDRMRATNAEWDFMGRSFLVWALANQALRDPAQAPRALQAIDAILDETLRLERELGMYHFLMPYAHGGPFRVEPQASQFLDGEIALMLALRREVAEKPEYVAPLRERVERMAARMQKSPVLSAESYPDECWTFCNTVALAALRVADHLDGTDHSQLLRDWVAVARRKLVDPKTGLLVSSYTVDGRAKDGPEGSSIWLSAHMLQVVDADFAQDQYTRARRELRHGFLGFGWAGEWPASWRGREDVDSGPVIPWLDVSAGSSGLAFVGAAGFGDRAYWDQLWATLEMAGFPVAEGGTVRYAAGNQVGDAVLLYALTLGPMWHKVQSPRGAR
jgi:hypothetical protein